MVKKNPITKKLSNFSKKQWDFLAVLEAFGVRVPIDVVGSFVTLPASELVDLLQRTIEVGWVSKRDDATIGLSSKLPPTAKNRLSKINTSDRISFILGKLRKLSLFDEISPEARENLLVRAGRKEEAAFLNYDFACLLLQDRKIGKAIKFFDRVVDLLSGLLGDRECDSLFLSTALKLNRLRFFSTDRLSEIPRLLKTAQDAAQRLGDRRSHVLIKLNVARNIVLKKELDESLEFLASGLREVEELGDEDIKIQSAEFSGLYYFLQGRFKEALQYFEKAFLMAESQKAAIDDFLLPNWLAFSAAYTGQFYRAIGVLEYSWRLAQQMDELKLSDNFRAVLGTVLLMAGMKQEAFSHFQAVCSGSVSKPNPLALFFSRMGLSYYYYLESKLLDAYQTAKETVSRAKASNILLRQYHWPWFLEMLYEFYRLGFDPIPSFGYLEELERIIRGPNIHLKGIAFRLKAKETVRNNGPQALVAADLEASMAELERSGNPIELVRTRNEIARIKLRTGERVEASHLALISWEQLAGYDPNLFPDDLRPLLNSSKIRTKENSSTQDFMASFLEVMDAIVPSKDLDQFLHSLLEASSRFFGAERAGIFWFPQNGKRNRPLLRVGRNLTTEEINSGSFRSNMDLVMKTYKEYQPQVVRLQNNIGKIGIHRTVSLLCVPFEIRGEPRGVLYHDNSYLNDRFDAMPSSVLLPVARHVSSYIERMWDYHQIIDEKATILASERSQIANHPDKWDIKWQSPVMNQLIALADKVAQSEASVLILGETGVGKELLARRIHNKSSRQQGPFVPIDITSISENLIESELFGHEKGAFTGADKRKHGRLELVNRGTLFIDEIGEIPLSMQVKLLRALQEKAFVRVGGTRTIKSDFRLLTATNLDLDEEVSAGHFRADLFYRINVVPLAVPPLKERGKDIILIAVHYLNIYSKKYKCPEPVLNPEDQAKLLAYHWPGNVRELKNIMERAVILSTEGKLEFNLPGYDYKFSGDIFEDLPTMEELQRRYIRFILEKTGGKIAGSGGGAEILGMKRTTLLSRMKKLGLMEERGPRV